MLNKTTPLQQEQIDLGRQHGLSEKEIRVYAKPQYSYREMEIIRTGLEQGKSPQSAIKMLYPENRRIRIFIFPFVWFACFAAAGIVYINNLPHLYFQEEVIDLKSIHTADSLVDSNGYPVSSEAEETILIYRVEDIEKIMRIKNTDRE